jgi:dTDP-4-dehydrorhamnose reductase
LITISKKVIILGASGMLGHKMLQVLSRRFYTCGTLRKPNTSQILKPYCLYDNVDAKNFSSVLDVINKFKPDVIVNCIGIVKQLPESNDWDISHTINSEFPHKLDTYVQSHHGMKLIHISSDCVFDGTTGLYNEGSIPNATDIYGRTKFSGEVPNALTLRTSIIGRELNTCHGLLEWFLSKHGMKIFGYEKSIFSGVTTNELSQLVSNIIYSGFDFKGLYHVASEPISKFDLLMKINECIDEKVIIEPIDGEFINRSLNGDLLLGMGFKINSWDDMLKEMLVTDRTDYGGGL